MTNVYYEFELDNLQTQEPEKLISMDNNSMLLIFQHKIGKVHSMRINIEKMAY